MASDHPMDMMIPGTIMKNKAGIMARYIKPINVKYSPMNLRYFPSKMNRGEITFPLLNSMGMVAMAIVVPTFK